MSSTSDWRDRVKRDCQNPDHPFIQKWYWYDERHDSPKYCSSCSSHLIFVKIVLLSAVEKRATLYGDKVIKVSKAEAHKLIDEIYEDS